MSVTVSMTTVQQRQQQHGNLQLTLLHSLVPLRELLPVLSEPTPAVRLSSASLSISMTAAAAAAHEINRQHLSNSHCSRGSSKIVAKLAAVL